MFMLLETRRNRTSETKRKEKKRREKKERRAQHSRGQEQSRVENIIFVIQSAMEQNNISLPHHIIDEKTQSRYENKC